LYQELEILKLEDRPLCDGKDRYGGPNMTFIKPKLILPVAIIAGAFATFGAFNTIEKKKQSIKQPEIITESVVVATADLGIGNYLASKNMMIKEWPVELVPRGSFAKMDSLLERVLKTEVSTGEAILVNKLAPKGSMGGFSSLIPPGMRAMTVAVNVVSGVNGFILPRTRVDVLVTASPSHSKEEATTKIILDNVEVMAIDQTVDKDDSDPMTVKSVTLLVNPVQAGKLALAMNEGTLQLALRNSSDKHVADDDGIALKELMAKKFQPKAPIRTYRAPVKKQEPKEAPKRIVEVYRSNERSEVSFKETKE
jgi:pilus assembly protein CpaB